MNTVIWGTGKIASRLDGEHFELGKIVAYCDSNEEKWGASFNNIKIISPCELLEKCNNKEVDQIFIAIQSRDIIDEIRRHYLFENVGVIVNDYYSVETARQKEVLDNIQNNAVEIWNVDFDIQAEEWVNNLSSEVDFWLNQVARGRNAIFHEDYIRRIRNSEFNGIDPLTTFFESYNVQNNQIVLDVGCGLCSIYGNVYNGKNVKVIPVDPLAHFYNIINNIYAKDYKRKCYFGLFEFLSSFFEKNYADLILINNALDHCIDPYKSIIQCLHVLKKEGCLHLRHRRAEALFENYSGLHKWNIDYGVDNTLVLWNNDNYINVSKRIKDFAKINLFYSTSSVTDRENEFITAEIIKTNDFDIGLFYDERTENQSLARLLSFIMQKYANEVSNIF